MLLQKWHAQVPRESDGRKPRHAPLLHSALTSSYSGHKPQSSRRSLVPRVQWTTSRGILSAILGTVPAVVSAESNVWQWLGGMNASPPRQSGEFGKSFRRNRRFLLAQRSKPLKGGGTTTRAAALRSWFAADKRRAADKIAVRCPVDTNDPGL